jgi:hypothetical protein
MPLYSSFPFFSFLFILATDSIDWKRKRYLSYFMLVLVCVIVVV